MSREPSRNQSRCSLRPVLRNVFSQGVCAIAILGVATAASSWNAPAATPASLPTQARAVALSKAQLVEHYGRLPLSFEANQGQAAARTRFVARGLGYALYLTSGGAVLALHKPESGSRRRGRFGRSPEILGLATPGTASPASRSEEVIQMQLAGANPALQPSGESPLPGRSSYFVGNDSAKWRTGVPTYAQVRYAGVYPGVDLVYYGNQRQLEYDFVVAPGADPRPIRLRFEGANSVKMDGEGNLVIAAGEGEVAFRKPVVYQLVGGTRRPVEGSFRLMGVNTAGFALGAYDRAKPLVIDPVLSYSTYLGGSRQEYAESIAVDSAGNAYVTGLTWSVDFPLTAGAVDAVNYASSVNSVSTAFIAS